ncbi:hypothetical protein BJ508DRAFT_322895 [Ascobolus immersus RN42]|uniref:F-box domain-containing protein n=1 Tax=Ascobolus immersus RN42 TaxID=1160509 RepID=A0A3N4IK55_ASCIM|nr:hypothetical protein BJ508DRAFT_322895 [Ascobolus immersus RN42]
MADLQLHHLIYPSTPQPTRLNLHHLAPNIPLSTTTPTPTHTTSSLGTLSILPPELLHQILSNLPLSSLTTLLTTSSTLHTLVTSHPTYRLLTHHTPTLLRLLLTTGASSLHPLSKLVYALRDPTCRLCRRRYTLFPSSRTTPKPQRFFASSFDIAQGIRVCVECMDLSAGLDGGVVTAAQAEKWFGIGAVEAQTLPPLTLPSGLVDWDEVERTEYGLTSDSAVTFYRVKDLRRHCLRKFGSRRRWEREKAKLFLADKKEKGEKMEVAFQRWEREYVRHCCEGVGVMTAQAALFWVEVPVIDRAVLREGRGVVDAELDGPVQVMDEVGFRRLVEGRLRHTVGYGCKGCFATRFTRGVWPRFARRVVYREGYFTHHEMVRHVEACHFAKRLKEVVRWHPRREFWREFLKETVDPMESLREGRYGSYLEGYVEDDEQDDEMDVGMGFWSDSED